MTDPPPFDLPSVLGRLGNDHDLFVDLARFFLTDGPEMLQTARAALEHSQPQQLSQAAHALKGMTANLSAEPARHAAERLERQAAESNLADAASTLDELAQEIDRLQRALETYC